MTATSHCISKLSIDFRAYKFLLPKRPVIILAHGPGGVTSNLQTRVRQHKNGEGGKFTSTYNCHCLLYYEEYNHINKAIEREKNLKN